MDSSKTESTNTIIDHLNNEMTHHKLENAILIIPSDTSTSKTILEKLDNYLDINNITIIHSSISDGKQNNIILELSNYLQQAPDSSKSQPIHTELYSENSVLTETENDNATIENQIKEYLTVVTNIAKTITNHKNRCPLSSIQSENENILSSLNHQLRTPLHTITSGVSVLETKTQDVVSKRILQHLLNSCLELNIYINDIMDFYMLKGESIEMEYTYFKLETLLEDVNSFFISDITYNNITYKYQVSLLLTKKNIKTDYKRLKQIIHYLLSNSIKFTKDEVIYLEIKVDKESHIMFTLIDTGCGIKEQEKTKVWNPFYQIDDQWMTNQKGLGLGLSNAKMLCKELGGDIYFINNPYNKGTAIQFYIKNHITKIKRDLPEIPTRPNLKIDISAIDIDISRLYPKYDNFKLLIIEDHSMNAELLKLMLESNFKKENIKNEIDVITDSSLVIEKLLEFQTDNFYDTIYMDLKMPTLSGFELLTLINENEVLSKIYNNRIILITALANDKATVKLKANQLVKKILFKPIRIRDL